MRYRDSPHFKDPLRLEKGYDAALDYLKPPYSFHTKGRVLTAQGGYKWSFAYTVYNYSQIFLRLCWFQFETRIKMKGRPISEYQKLKNRT